MKHMYRKLTAITAAVITAVSASGMTAFAYGLPDRLPNGDLDLPLHQYTYSYNRLSSYEKNVLNHEWSTANLQDVYPSFRTEDFNGSSSYTATIAKNTHLGWGGNEKIFCTLAYTTASKSDLEQIKRDTDKFNISQRQSNGTAEPLGSVLEYDEEAHVNHFAIRLLNHYNMNNLLSQMRLEDYTFDSVSGEYSGKFVLYDSYVAGMKLSSSDVWTTFEEPVIVEDDGFIQTEISFTGQVPNPNRPEYKNGYYKIMNRTEFLGAVYDLVYLNCSRRLRQYDGHVLTNLTVTYNGSESSPYTTNRFNRLPKTT